MFFGKHLGKNNDFPNNTLRNIIVFPWGTQASLRSTQISSRNTTNPLKNITSPKKHNQSFEKHNISQKTQPIL
jgi:hypothetical protein